jgi:sec-independent protein translocase protein TatA
MGFLKEPSHLIIVGLIVVILFGSRRLPDAARGLGQSMRIFKSEIKQMQTEDKVAKRPGPEAAAEPPLEGRVVSPQAPRLDEPVRETPRDV